MDAASRNYQEYNKEIAQILSGILYIEMVQIISRISQRDRADIISNIIYQEDRTEILSGIS